MRRRRLVSWLLAPVVASLAFACGDDDDAKPVAVPPDGAVDSSRLDTGTDAPRDAGADVVADAHADAVADADADATITKTPPRECTGAGLGVSTDITRLRVHPDGSLYVLASSLLHKYMVGTDCVLTKDPTFVEVGGVNDIDLDAAGNLYTIQGPALHAIRLDKRNPATGAATATTCTFGPESNATWGRLGVSPDGTKAAIVSTNSVEDDAGTGVYAYTVTIGATCIGAAWKPALAGDCNPSGAPLLSQAVRSDNAKAYIACAHVNVFAPGGASPTFTSAGFASTGHIEDLVLGMTSIDVADSKFASVHRFDRSTGLYQKTFTVTDLLGTLILDASASAYLIYALTDVAAGKRYLALTHDAIHPNHIYRLDDF